MLPDVKLVMPAVSAQSRVAAATVGQALQGRFRVGRTFDNRSCTSGSVYRVIELVDHTGHLRANAWPSTFSSLPAFPEWSIVDAAMEIRQKECGPFGCLAAIALVPEPAAVDQADALPPNICPVAGVVDVFRTLVTGIVTPVLQGFVARVLADAELMRAYFRVPASRDDHQAYPGGMAAHAVDMGVNATKIGGLSPLSRDCVIVLALFHDIGKTMTGAPTPQGNLAHKFIQHDDLTLELLAKPLRWLGGAWPDGALALRHAWTAASPGARYGVEPAWAPAVILQRLDAISRAMAMQREHPCVNDLVVELSRGRKVWAPREP